MVFLPISIANYGQIAAAEMFVKTIKPYAPVMADSGRETWFRGAGAFVCTDGRAWSQVWDQHIQNEGIGNQRVGNLNPAPAVDFTANVLVALFAGPTRGIVGYRTVAGYIVGKEAFLRLVPIPSTSNVNNVALPSPWAFLVIPRTAANVTIQLRQGKTWNTVAKVKPTL